MMPQQRCSSCIAALLLIACYIFAAVGVRPSHDEQVMYFATAGQSLNSFKVLHSVPPRTDNSKVPKDGGRLILQASPISKLPNISVMANDVETSNGGGSTLHAMPIFDSPQKSTMAQDAGKAVEARATSQAVPILELHEGSVTATDDMDTDNDDDKDSDDNKENDRSIRASANDHGAQAVAIPELPEGSVTAADDIDKDSNDDNDSDSDNAKGNNNDTAVNANSNDTDSSASASHTRDKVQAPAGGGMTAKDDSDNDIDNFSDNDAAVNANATDNDSQTNTIATNKTAQASAPANAKTDLKNVIKEAEAELAAEDSEANGKNNSPTAMDHKDLKDKLDVVRRGFVGRTWKRKDRHGLIKRMTQLLEAEEARKEKGTPETRTLEDMEAKESNVEIQHDEELTGAVVALVLLGFLMFDLCILYMVNYPDEQVRSYSYKMVSQCLSVLCAVLMETAQLTFCIQIVLFNVILGGYPVDAESEHGPGTHSGAQHDAKNELRDEVLEFFTAFVIFLVWFYLISSASKWQRTSTEGLFAVNALVAHQTAFIAIHAFGNLQENWSYGFWIEEEATISLMNQGLICNYILTPLGILLLLRVLTSISSYLRESVPERVYYIAQAPAPQDEWKPLDAIDCRHGRSSDLWMPSIAEGDPEGGANEAQELAGEDKETRADAAPADAPASALAEEALDEAWCENSSEGEDEMCAIVIAWFLRQASLFLTCERIPFMEGDFLFHTPAMFAKLGGFIVFYLFLMIAITGYMTKTHQCAGHHPRSPSWWRLVKFSQALMAMAVAWHCLSFARWNVQTYVSHEALQFMCSAFLLSPCGFYMVVIVDMLADNELIYESTAEVCMKSAGLLVGFAWEKAFHMSIHVAIRHLKHMKSCPNLAEVGLCTSLALLLLPAWRFSIVPEASKEMPDRSWINNERKRLSAAQDIAGLEGLKRLSPFRKRIGAKTTAKSISNESLIDVQ